uniref:Gypsy retrotransposon integrase-like protein 1 n=1 Tax=Sphaeramia orbicularis TaxID=375764 RepID=A0A673CI67_9TELE
MAAVEKVLPLSILRKREKMRRRLPTDFIYCDRPSTSNCSNKDTSTSLESKSTSLELKMSVYKEQMEMLIKYLRTGRYRAGLDKAQKRNIRNQTKNHFLDSNNQLMYRKTATLSLKVVVCPAEVKDILRQYHVSAVGGHSGINTTMGKIVQHYWWQAMKADVVEYVSTCPNCQIYKKLRTQAPKLNCVTVNKPLELVGMDLMGPHPETARGHKYILMFTDYFTKFMDFFPLSTKSAQGVAEGIKTFVSRWGTPARLLSDQGREFVAEVNTALCAEFGIKCSVTSAYHPQTNGLNDRTNQTLKVRISKLINDQQNNWDDYLHNLAAPKDEDDEKPVTLTLNASDTSAHNETSSSSDVSTLPPPSPARTSTQPPPDPVHAALLHRQRKLNLYTSFTNYLNSVLQKLPEADANKLMKDIHGQMMSYM